MQLRGCRRGLQTVKVQRRAQRMPELHPGGDFYYGDRHQLTVLVAFSDRTFKGDEAATVEQWDKIFNAENYAEDKFVGSVHDYFHDQSLGKLNVIFDLQYVALDEEHAKYRSTSSDDENSQFLVQDVMAVLKTRDIDWSLYDWNGNGYVNQLLIIFAGKGSGYGGFGGGNDAIWPHQYWLSWHVNPETQENCEPITLTYDDKQYTVDSYCALQELDSSGGYGSFGTICHEYTHCFGFPDFYNERSYLRSWELMDSGNYNGGGYTPCNYSAHERWLMGWLTLEELTETTAVTQMPSLSDCSAYSSPLAYLIRNDGYENEYYIVENRQQTGWDSMLPGSGLVVFHIDYNPTCWIEEYPNSKDCQRYYIIPANNKTYYTYSDGWPYPYQGDEKFNDQLTNTSEPAATLLHANADGTMLMSKSLTGISVTDGLASFEFTKGDVTGITEKNALSSAQSVYDLHGRYLGAEVSTLPRGFYVIRSKDGTRKIVRQ